MQKNILNFIIVVSLFAIVIAVSKDYFFKDKTEQPIIQGQTVIPTLIPSPKVSNLIICDNPYFSFKKGTTWKYKLQDNASTSYFTTEIIKNNTSSVDLQTTTDAKQVTTSSVYCKKDGLYGLPIPILSFLTKNGSGSLGQLSTMIKLDTNFKLLPNKEELKLNNTWVTKVPISVSLPISIPLGVSFNNTISNISIATFPPVGVIKTVHIKSIMDLQGLTSFLPQDKNASSSAAKGNTFEYTIGEKVGITDFKLGIDTSSMQITLTEFSP